MPVELVELPDVLLLVPVEVPMEPLEPALLSPVCMDPFMVPVPELFGGLVVADGPAPGPVAPAPPAPPPPPVPAAWA
jgi:hypothetical protein